MSGHNLSRIKGHPVKSPPNKYYGVSEKYIDSKHKNMLSVLSVLRFLII